MTAIWLLSSRGRPREAQACVDACEAAGMTSPGVLYVDETVNLYRDLRLPGNWTIHTEAEWGSLQASMTWVFERYPDASQYGWLADDTRPRTKRWDSKLEQAAGDWGLAYANDDWHSNTPIERSRLEQGHNLSSGLCWGGDLVRCVGWWALPGVRQAGIDTAWTELVRPLGLHRYQPDIVVEHLNWRTGKRPKDQGDSWQRAGDDYIERDIASRDAWVRSADYRAVLSRLVDRSGVGRSARVELALEQSRIDELLVANGGIKSSELQRWEELYAEVQRIDAYTEPARLDPPGS